MANVMAEIKAAGEESKGASSRCKLTAFLKKQPPADALEFIRVIKNPDSGFQVTDIWRAMRKRGLKSTVNTVHYHRSVGCLGCDALEALLKKGKR
jgi:hypothetical protein